MFAAIFLLPQPAAFADTKPAPQAYSIRQTNSLTGEVVVTIAGADAKFDCRTLQYSLLISGKNNTATILNHRTKLYFTTSAANWRPNSFQLTNILSFGNPSLLKFKEAKPDHILTLAAQKEIFVDPERHTTPGQTKSEKLSLAYGEVVTCPQLTNNPSIIKAAIKLYFLPDCKSFPMQYDATKRKGKKDRELSTSNISKVAVNPQLVSIPPGFKQAKSEHEASLSAGANSVMEDFADIMK